MEFTNTQVQDILRRIEDELTKQGKTKGQFYEESGISSSSFSQWNKGSRKLSMSSVSKIASYLGVSLDYLINGVAEQEDDSMGIREALRNDPQMRMLFHAAKDVPPSAILEAAAMLMKYKEGSNN